LSTAADKQDGWRQIILEDGERRKRESEKSFDLPFGNLKGDE
jgi:hypothetical protein